MRPYRSGTLIFLSLIVLVLSLVCLQSISAISTQSLQSAQKVVLSGGKVVILPHDEQQYQTYNPSKNGVSLPWIKDTKAEVLCLHGFGGNLDQFRKNLPVLANAGYRSHAMDLLGYGYSDKPNPKLYEVNEIYNFDTWSDQAISFIEQKVKEPVYIVCNSVGGVAGLTTAVKRPDLVKGVVLINISLRLLHTKKQNPLQRPITSLIQTVLRESPVGKTFFKQVATPKVLKNILSQAYAEPVDDEVVDLILQPGLEPGAADVFLDFISYSGGPLPEELLPQVQCPVRILWGENDPWEPINLGRAYGDFPCVDEFVSLQGGGHCPMDQIPDLVNSELLRFLNKATQRN